MGFVKRQASLANSCGRSNGQRPGLHFSHSRRPLCQPSRAREVRLGPSVPARALHVLRQAPEVLWSTPWALQRRTEILAFGSPPGHTGARAGVG